MQETCDMHLHTNNSDGVLSGTELLKLAKKQKLKKLSITDHDCVDFYLDETNVEMLKEFIAPNGKISPRRTTGTCAKHQRELAKAIKNARFMALLPYVAD